MVGAIRKIEPATRDRAPRIGDRVVRPTKDHPRNLNTVRGVIAHWPALQLAPLRPESGGLWEIEVNGERKPFITITVAYNGDINGLPCWLEVSGR